MASGSHSLPFDRVAVGSGDRQTLMTVKQFMALPLPTRVRHILQRDMSFYRGDEVVDGKLALRALMRGARE
jgi:hypothetical protein